MRTLVISVRGFHLGYLGCYGNEWISTPALARAALTQLAGLDRWLLWVDLATLLPPWEVSAEFSDPYFQELEEEEKVDEDEEEDIEEEGEPDEEFYEEPEEVPEEEPPGEEFV